VSITTSRILMVSRILHPFRDMAYYLSDFRCR